MSFKPPDLVQIWIGVATSLSALFAWLSWKVARGGLFLSFPHLTAHSHDSREPRRITMYLQGAGKEQWDVAEVRVSRFTRIKLAKAKWDSDSYGGVIWSEETAVGRAIKNPQQYFYVSSLDRPVKLRFKLALKASPSITSFRTITISKKD